MYTKNANGTFTVGGVVTVMTEEAALALLEGKDIEMDPVTAMAARPTVRYEMRVEVDEVSNMPHAGVFKVANGGF